MIRMIVVWPGRNDDIRFPLANLADHLFAHIHIRQELAVMVVQDFVFDADAPPGFLRFRASALGEFLSAHGLMPRIAVGERYELHLIAARGILGGEATGAKVTIIGMCAERDDAYRLILHLSRKSQKRQWSESADES